LPGGCLTAGLLQDPAPDRHDQPGFLRDRDEAVRHDQAALRVLEPEQRFDADDPAVVHRHLRLVVQLEPALGQAPAKIVLDPLAGPEGLVHALLVEPADAAPLALGPIERHVGLDQQALGIVAVGPTERHAEADIGEHLVAFGVEGLDDGRQQALREALGIDWLDDADLDDRELVAAEAGDGIAAADLVLQPLRELAQKSIAGDMAERIVDVLEARDVEAEDRDLAAVAPAAGQRLVQTVVEQQTVGQTGQSVVMGEEMKARRRLAMLRDVLEGPFDHGPAACGALDPRVRGDHSLRTVAEQQPVVGRQVAAARHGPVEIGGEGRPVVRMQRCPDGRKIDPVEAVREAEDAADLGGALHGGRGRAPFPAAQTGDALRFGELRLALPQPHQDLTGPADIEHPMAEQGPVDGFADEIGGARVIGPGDRVHIVLAGHHDDRGLGAERPAAQRPAGGIAVQPRHHHVEQHHRRRDPLERLERSIAVADRLDLEAGVLERFGHQEALHVIVVGDQHHRSLAGWFR
jgi:hypothetical protein